MIESLFSKINTLAHRLTITSHRIICLIFIGIFTLLTACENFPALQPQYQPQAQSFAMRYKKYSPSGESLDDSFIDEGLQLLFPAIPGGIFGNPSSRVLDYIEVKEHSFTLSLPANINEIAQPFASDKLTVSPKNLEIVRVETFHSVPNGPIGKGAFKNTESGNLLILVYFSKSAKITGELTNNGDVYVHDISVKRPGWHWLEISREDSAFILKKYEGSDNAIELALFVQNILNL